ncbi:MAG: tetratricopeptide repeat protein [Nitrospirota bacterium]
MPKAIKKRVAKKPLTTEEDVKQRLSTLKNTFRQRQKIVLLVTAGMLAILIAFAGFMIYSHNLQKKARMLEYGAYKIFHNQAQNDSGERYQKAMDMFRKAYDTKKSPISLYYVAACNYELGKYDDALKTLGEFVKRYPDAEKFLPLVYRKMATVYIRRGDTNGAMKALESLYNLKGQIYEDFALMEYGRILEKSGNPEDAKKKYKELTTRFPDSPFFSEARAKLSDEKEG